MRKILVQCFAALAFLFFQIAIPAQTIQKDKMSALSFMVGEWVGTSTTLSSDTVVNSIPAFEEIKYDLNKSILVIQLNSANLKLHTIIHYSVKDSTYYYYAFSEKGGGRLPGKVQGQKFIVQAGPDRRYIFEKLGENGFREYGEKKINGEWVKYFEDRFIDTQ